MLEFIAGVGAGITAFTALSFALASRKDWKAREQMRRFAEMQRAVFAVQDATALILMDAPTGKTLLESVDAWQQRRAARDRAAAAYFAAMGG